MLFFTIIDLTFAAHSQMRRYHTRLDLFLFARTYTTGPCAILRQAKNTIIPESFSRNPSNILDSFMFCYACDQVLEENKILREKLKSLGISSTPYENLVDRQNFDAIQNSTSFQSDDNFDETFINAVLKEQNPLYPITTRDLTKILRVYTALSNCPAGGISNVLTGHINSGKSPTYSNIVAYVQQQNSTLDEYRRLYAKITKSLGQSPIQMMKRISSSRRKSTS